MLAHFFLFSLQTTAALANHSFGAVMNATANATSTSPNQDSPNTRTVWSLVWSCMTIIFSCTWVAIHPNVPGPRDTGFDIFRSKLKVFFIALIAPEWMAMWAFRQFLSAGKYRDRYNKDNKVQIIQVEDAENGVKSEIEDTQDTRKCANESVKGPYWSAVWTKLGAFWLKKRQSDPDKWTLAHGYLMVMGGFILQDDNSPAFPVVFQREIDPSRINFKTFPAMERLKLGDNLASVSTLTRCISVDEIKDKSKGDILGKSIVLIQLAWFATQVIARAAEHLPITALEITTLAYVVVSGILYAIWWHKPKDIRYPVAVKLSASAKSIHQSDQEEHVDFEFENFFSMVFSSKRVDDYDVTRSHRLPQFYSGELGNKTEQLCVMAEMTLGFTFGAIHSAAWFFDFQTPTERWIWRISALVVTFVPVLVIVSLLLYYIAEGTPYNRSSVMKWVIKAIEGASIFLLVGCMTAGAFAYVIARFLLLAVTFTSLRHLPQGALHVVEWTTLVPHFG